MTAQGLHRPLSMRINEQVHVRPTWNFKEVSFGDSYAGLASAFGDTLVYGDLGKLEGASQRVPDARLSVDLALDILGLPARKGAPEAMGAGAEFPNSATHAFLSRTALVGWGAEVPRDEDFRLVLGNGLELVVSMDIIVGWILMNPLEHISLPGCVGVSVDEDFQAAFYEIFQLVDENVDVAIDERPNGFIQVVYEACAIANSAPRDQQNALRTLVDSLFGNLTR